MTILTNVTRIPTKKSAGCTGSFLDVGSRLLNNFDTQVTD